MSKLSDCLHELRTAQRFVLVFRYFLLVDTCVLNWLSAIFDHTVIKKTFNLKHQDMALNRNKRLNLVDQVRSEGS